MNAVAPLRDFLVLVDVRYKEDCGFAGDHDLCGYKVTAASAEDIAEPLRAMILESLEGEDDVWLGASIVSIVDLTGSGQGQVFKDMGLSAEYVEPQWYVERYQNHRDNSDGTVDIETLDFVMPGPRPLVD
jgi:hypothetical protein